MKLIVGLGNPGRDYSNTRHNVGFMFVDRYLDYKNIQASWKNKFNGLLFKCNIDGEDIVFLKPQTFMNLSGDSIRKVVDYYNISVSNILIVSDDLDLYVGNFKLKPTGSSGGHNGLKDIELKLGTREFKRLKIGISNNKDIDTKDYVLGRFSKDELKVLDELFNTLFIVIDDYYSMSFSDLMNKYNSKNK